MRVFDPLVSRVMVPCERCGARCYVALNGRTLLDANRVRPRKASSPHDKVTHEAERHDYYCQGIG